MTRNNHRIAISIVFLFSFLGIFTFGCVNRINVKNLRLHNREEDLEEIYESQPKFETPLNLYDVVEIALIHNLDIYAQRYELEAQKRISNAQNLRMLPPLTLDGTYSYRTKPNEVFALLVLPPSVPQPSPVYPQISSLQTSAQADVRDTLNLIDLGIGYVRTQEEKKKNIVLEQQQLRTRQKFVLDVVQAYWRAIAAREALKDISDVIALSRDFQERLLTQIHEKALSELVGLQIRARLLDQEIQLQETRYQYKSALGELGGLMGLVPGTEFELADVNMGSCEIKIEDLKALEEEALTLRPDVYTKDLEEKIAIDKIRESIIQLLPNVSLYADRDYDGNPFLIYNYWTSVGVRAIWNLFLIPQQLQERRSAQSQREFAKTTRLALSIGVMTQVHLAYINYQDTLHQYKLALKSFNTRSRLSEIAEIARESGEFQGLDTLDFMTGAVLAKIFAWKIYSSVKIAEEQLNFAVGRPLYFGSQGVVNVGRLEN